MTALAATACGRWSIAIPREPLEATISPSSLLLPFSACGSISPIFEFTSDWKTAPSAATPVAIPTWRKVELIPDPIPDFSTGTTAIAAWPIPGLVTPMPMPAIRKPTRSDVHSESARDSVHEEEPDPDQGQAGAEQEPDRDPVGERARHRRCDETENGQRQEAQAGLER